MNNIQKIKKIAIMQYIALVFALIGLILSIVIQIENNGYKLNHPGVCSLITGSNGCETVQTSEYGKVFGINNAVYGIFAFSILIMLALLLIILKHDTSIIRKKMLNFVTYVIIFGATIAASIAVYFIYIQSQIIHAYCIFCMTVDILSIMFFFVCIYWAYLLYLKNMIHK